MKKTGAICFLVTLTCAALLLTACQKDGGDSGNDSSYSGLGKGGEDAADMGGAVPEKEWAYVPEFITVGDDRASYGDMQLLGDTVCYISMVSEVAEEAQKICRYSLADRELTQISIQWPIEEQNREICSFAFNPDYSVWLIVNAYSADYSQLNRYLCRFDSEGRNLAALDITQEMGRGSSVGDMAVDGQGRIYVFTSEHAEEGEAGVWLYTGDGDYQERLCFSVSETVRLIGTIEGDDGRFYACISKGESPDCCTMLEVDFEGKRLTEVDTEFPNVNGLCKGKQYDLLLYDDRFVCGYDFPAEGSGSGQMPEELFAWTDSDINGYFVEDLRTLGEDRYYATVENWINKDRSIVVLRRTKASDVVPRKNMVLAAVDGGGDLAALAIKFNRSQGQYHIDVADYDSLTDLYNAILTKEAVDIINLSGVDVESLSRQGIFEDLMPYLERFQDLAPSDFVEGLLDTYTVNDLLAGIPERFRLETLGGDRGLLEGEPGLTLERLFAIAERNPEALPVGEVTKEEVMRYLMMFNQDAFRGVPVRFGAVPGSAGVRQPLPGHPGNRPGGGFPAQEDP